MGIIEQAEEEVSAAAPKALTAKRFMESDASAVMLRFNH